MYYVAAYFSFAGAGRLFLFRRGNASHALNHKPQYREKTTRNTHGLGVQV